MALPANVWRPTDGIGEAGQSDGEIIIAQDSFVLITQDGESLKVEDGTYTKLAANEWIVNDGE
jgi:hypothetical protein